MRLSLLPAGRLSQGSGRTSWAYKLTLREAPAGRQRLTALVSSVRRSSWASERGRGVLAPSILSRPQTTKCCEGSWQTVSLKQTTTNSSKAMRAAPVQDTNLERRLCMGHQSGDDMSSYAFVERAREWSTRLEDREVFKGNADNLREARVIVAREVGAMPGTLENLRNRRLKGIAAHIYDRLRARVIRELESEMRHLEHELQILKQTGVGPSDRETEAVVASLAKVRQTLGLPDGGGA